MTDEIVVAKENFEAFKEACKLDKIYFEIIGEGIDGDTYRLTFDYPSQLYYMGRAMQLMITTNHFMNKIKL